MDMQHDHQMVAGEHSPVEVAKFVGVITGIFLISWLLYQVFGQPGLTDWSRWFMGVFFAVFAGFKLAGYTMFAQMFAGYDIVAKKFMVYGYLYPFIELSLAVLYLGNFFPSARDWITFIVMSLASVGVAQEIRRRSGIHCACLGNIIKLPLSTVSLVENVGMGLMALLMLSYRI